MRRVLLVFGAIAAAPLAPHPARAQAARGAPLPSPAPTAALSPFAAHKARLLLRTHLPCLGCHRYEGEGGTIGPDLTTVTQRRSHAYIAAIIADPQRIAPGSMMPRTLMPAETRALVTALLQQEGGGEGGAGTSPPGGGAPAGTGSSVPAPGEAPTPPDGAALYTRWCAACHGARGGGDGVNAAALPIPPTPHTDATRMAARPDDSLYDTIAGGGAIMNRSPRMPSFGATLSPAEIRALVAHIRQLCRCEGPSWSRDGAGPR